MTTALAAISPTSHSSKPSTTLPAVPLSVDGVLVDSGNIEGVTAKKNYI